MFTGIVETMGTLRHAEKDSGNIHFFVESSLANALKIDQSLSHDGVCLTVVEIKDNLHKVTAVHETLIRTAIGQWENGTRINLERCLKADGRFDGHIVQGHVDCTAQLEKVEDQQGSYKLWFTHNPEKGLTVEKGSICVNGTSLTVVDSQPDRFSVVIIPYTWENTNLGSLSPGSLVNLEFDIVGKYLQKLAAR